MWQWGALAFAQPWLLLGLLALPVMWHIIRFTPPAPRRLSFPSLRLLKFLTQKNDTPRRSPWWLLALRLAIAGLIIIAAARPILNPEANLLSRDHVLLVIDNNWANAAKWPTVRRQAQQILDIAGRANKTAQLLLTTPDPDSGYGFLSSVQTAEALRQVLQAVQPKPWPARFDLAATALQAGEVPSNPDIIWFTAGVSDENLTPLAERLNGLGRLRVIADTLTPLLVLYPKNFSGESMTFNLRRYTALMGDLPAATYTVLAQDQRGRILARETLRLDADQASGEGRVELPVQVKNTLQRLRIAEQTHAATQYLLDERGRQYPVGIITAHAMDSSKPFLDEHYYIERAIAPFADIHAGTIQQLLQNNLAVIIMTDRNSPNASEAQALRQWVAQGGMVIRFAGPKLLRAPEGLSPVALRPNLREMGGNLTWAEAPGIGPIPAASPLFGLTVARDVTIKKQILAENEAELGQKTWLALSDGTPLITGQALGQGQLVLFHVAADDSWSNLMLSGLFVESLQRLIWLSSGVTPANTEQNLALQEMLDAFGRLQAPPVYSKTMTADELQSKRVSAAYPPGYYGTNLDRHAFNLSDHMAPPEMMTRLPSGSIVQDSLKSAEIDVRPWLYGLILLLAIVDTLVRLNIGRFFPALRRGTAVVFVIAACGWPQPVNAADNAQKVHLAYARTGNTAVDRITLAGMRGLNQILSQRTAVDVAAPVAVDIATDELAFYPLLYWPVVPNATPLSSEAAVKLATYLQNGGLLVIDTRDGTGAMIADNTVARQFGNLFLPSLQPLPSEHVLLRSFYLLKSWPGRYDDVTLWVTNDADNQFDGVASVIVGTQDWAAAWAVDNTGRPLLPIAPGGENQRETARRFGVNLVMYALTGNYKADQVHVPAILERLGNAP